MSGRISEVIGPYVKAIFCRVVLKFPGNVSTLQAHRIFQTVQTQTLGKLNATNFLSGVPGSKNKSLWMTRNRTVEDRNKIRALVQVKEVFIHTSMADNRDRETPEIVWRGRVYVGRVQVIAEPGNLPGDGHPSGPQMSMSLTTAETVQAEWFLRRDFRW